MDAIKFGLRNESCNEALVWRISLPPGSSQADAYLACQRGDWIMWQLRRLSREKLRGNLPALIRSSRKTVARAVGTYAAKCESSEIRTLAKAWLSGGQDPESATGMVEAWKIASHARHKFGTPVVYACSSAILFPWAEATFPIASASCSSCVLSAALLAAASTEDSDDAWIRELRRQADDIRSEIPTWPGD